MESNLKLATTKQSQPIRNAIEYFRDVYNLLNNNATVKLANEKNFQLYEETFFSVFKRDLINFCK